MNADSLLQYLLPINNNMNSNPSRNVEIKAKVNNIDELLQKSKTISECEPAILNQRDTFYNTGSSDVRFKLREENGKGTLISYVRLDVEGPKLSEYRKCAVGDPAGLSDVLEHALGVRGRVIKTRQLFLIGQTRLHVDQVKDLGDFMELEVVLREDQSAEEGQIIADQLMEQLSISKKDLLAGAYMDMLLASTSDSSVIH